MKNDMTKGCDIKGTREKRLVPELRFPEFEKEGEWEEKKLGEISNIINEKCKVKDLNIETYISTENILKDYAGITQIAKLPQTGSFTLFLKGDILVANIRPYLKKIWIADFDGAASNDVIVFRSNENLNNSYVSHLIKNDDFVNYCMAGAKGVKMPRGDKEMMINYSVPTPSSTDEQQKIAECLSSIDEEIGAIKEKVEQLKIHKKGLLQKLFPIAGKFVPERRFPKFKKDREWKEQKLEDVARTYSGGTPSVNNKEYYNGDIPFIRSGEINKDTTELFLTHWGVEKSSAKIIKEGTILYALYGATSGEVAISKIGGAINQAILAIIPDTEYSSLYIYQYLKNEKKNIINSYLQGGQGNLSGTIINNLRIPFPSPAEQQKIAECLSSIDELISLYENKVTLLELHKKGLMQRLFPKL